MPLSSQSLHVVSDVRVRQLRTREGSRRPSQRAGDDRHDCKGRGSSYRSYRLPDPHLSLLFSFGYGGRLARRRITCHQSVINR